MTTAAICATREVSWSPSFYRGEQYDSDLSLYYLRARYYNPATGRFMSRDPLDGKAKIPASLHKYLYADGDPVNLLDPMGREVLVEYKVTMICGGSLYCGPVITWAGVKLAFIYSVLAEYVATQILEPSMGEGSGPGQAPVDSGEKPGNGGFPLPNNPPVSGPPVAGAP